MDLPLEFDRIRQNSWSMSLAGATKSHGLQVQLLGSKLCSDR